MKLNAGLIIGLAGGLIGGAVGLASAWMADPVAGIVVTAVMFFVFFIMYRAFIKPNMDYSRLLKTGIRGTGTVLSISETGTRINNQPLCKIELQVHIPGQVAYTAVTKTVISYLQAAQFYNGAEVAILVDPANHQKLVLLRKEDAAKEKNPLANASPEQIQEFKDKLLELQKENDQIKAIGIYSKAIVTKFTNLGVNINGNNPLASIEIQVLPDNEPAFAATVKNPIKESSVPLFQPGEEIFVKYDPNDKTRVAIEHS
jgi:divalent metal cation (Fe/Co/Zn/Cd) transporter